MQAKNPSDSQETRQKARALANQEQAAKRREEQLRRQEKQLRERQEALQSHSRQLQDRQQTLKKTQETLDKQNRQLKRDLASLSEERKAWEKKQGGALRLILGFCLLLGISAYLVWAIQDLENTQLAARDENRNLLQQMERLISRLNESGVLNARLSTDLDQASTAQANAASKIQQLSAQLGEQNKQLRGLETMLDASRQQVQALQQERKQLNQRLQQNETSLGNINAEADRAEQALSDISQERDMLANERKLLQMRLDETRQQSQRLTENNQRLFIENNSQTRQLLERQTALTLLDGELAQTGAKLAQAEAENSNLLRMLMQSESDQMINERALLEANLALQALQSRIAELEANASAPSQARPDNPSVE